MRVVIVAYDGVDIWDMVIPYEILRQHESFEVIIATNAKDGRIITKDKNLTVTNLADIKSIDEADILWICSGEAKIEDLQKEERIKVDIVRLALKAKKVVAIGAASIMLLGVLITDYKAVCSNPYFASKIKKAKATYNKEIIMVNDNIISCSCRVGALFSVFMILHEFAGDEIKKDIFFRYGFDKSIFKPKSESELSRRNKLLKRLYKQTVSRKPNHAISKVSVDSASKSMCFYLQEGFNALSFALLYGVISNYQLLDIYCVADKKGVVGVEGGGFGIIATHSLHQIKRVHTLVMTGGNIVDNRLGDTYLKFWVSELSPKCSMVIALDGSEKIIGASGALTGFDPAFEEDAKNSKFVFFDSSGPMLSWLKDKLPSLVGEVQAEIYLAEYYN